MGKALTALDNFFGIWTQKDSTGVGDCDYDQQLQDFPSWKLCLWGFKLRSALSGLFGVCIQRTSLALAAMMRISCCRLIFTLELTCGVSTEYLGNSF